DLYDDSQDDLTGIFPSGNNGLYSNVASPWARANLRSSESVCTPIFRVILALWNSTVFFEIVSCCAISLGVLPCDNKTNTSRWRLVRSLEKLSGLIHLSSNASRTSGGIFCDKKRSLASTVSMASRSSSDADCL